MLGYIHIVLSYSAPSNHGKKKKNFTSCAWKELTLCLENAHKCVKYSCVTQRLFYNHTAAFAVHIFCFSLYSSVLDILLYWSVRIMCGYRMKLWCLSGGRGDKQPISCIIYCAGINISFAMLGLSFKPLTFSYLEYLFETTHVVYLYVP